MADVELFPVSNVLKQKLYCIVDFKSLTILPPFLANNDDEAIRNFSNLVNYANSAICRFPDDFKLYCIGDYITTYTGKYDISREALEAKIKQDFTFVASADLLKEPDTIKYDDLNKKCEELIDAVSNSNKVLLEQIGNVPNLSKDVNLALSKLSALQDKIEHIEHSENLIEPTKQGFLDFLFKK